MAWKREKIKIKFKLFLRGGIIDAGTSRNTTLINSVIAG
jgi:hypothetical protein